MVTTTAQAPVKPQSEVQELQCSHCGHKGPDVVRLTLYVGGHGYAPFTLCQDREACWQRWEEQEGVQSWK